MYYYTNVYYKPYTKTEIKKGWDKDIVNFFFLINFIKSIFFLHFNGLPCTFLGVHMLHFGAMEDHPMEVPQGT